MVRVNKFSFVLYKGNFIPGELEHKNRRYARRENYSAQLYKKFFHVEVLKKDLFNDSSTLAVIPVPKYLAGRKVKITLVK